MTPTLTQPVATITPEAAMVMVQAAIETAHANGWQVAVCVCDRAGVPVALWRSPQVALPPVGFAIDKAYTAALLGTSTQAFGERAQAKPTLALGLANRERLLVFAGGLPIRVDGEVIGGIGVSGAADRDDVVCAEAALHAVGLEP